MHLKLSAVVYSIIIAILSIVIISQGNDSRCNLHEYFMNEICRSNWTNCSTFLADTQSINTSSIVDIDWVIFYFWTIDDEETYSFRFSLASDLLIQRVRDMLVKEPQPPVNWSQAELFLDTSIDMSGLFFRTDTPGLYRFIPSMNDKINRALEVFFAFKVVDGYLGIVSCFHKMAFALAPVYKMPKNNEIETVVAKFNFWNPFGRSYLDVAKTPYDVDHQMLADLDDEEERQDLHIERTTKNMQIF